MKAPEEVAPVRDAFVRMVPDLAIEYGRGSGMVDRCEVDIVSDSVAVVDASVTLVESALDPGSPHANALHKRCSVVVQRDGQHWVPLHRHVSDAAPDVREEVTRAEMEKRNTRLEQIAIERYEQLRVFKEAIDVSPASIVISDPNGAIEYVNEQFHQTTGLSSAQVVGLDFSVLRSPDTEVDLVEEVTRHIREGKRWSGRALIRAAGGSSVWHRILLAPLTNDSGQVTNFVMILLDISEAKSLEDELRRFATTDPLTGVANRRRFLDFGSHTLKIAVRSAQPMSVILLDIDRFKDLNDWWGHKVGDRALCELAKAMRDTFRDSDLIARLGGDEFATILPNADARASIGVARRLRDRISRIRTRSDTGEKISMSVSIGVASVEGRDIVLDNLVMEADQALYRSKHLGRDTVTHAADFGQDHG